MAEPDHPTADAPTLTGLRLTLRPWRPGDAAAVHAAMQHRSMHRFLSLPDPYTEADAADFVTGIAPGGERSIERALVETRGGRLVGSVSLRFERAGPRDHVVSLGYAVYPAGQGHGYAREAVEALAGWAFGRGFARAEIQCAVDNLASAKTALNAGFGFEGVRRNGLHVRSRAADAALFARLPGDASGPVRRSFAPLPAGGLSDGVVRLRELDGLDALALHEQEADETTVANAFTGIAPARALAVATALRGPLDWLVGAAAPFAVVDEATGRFAGSIRLRQAGPPGVAGIGYAVHPAFRGRGVTGRALRLLVPWAFGPGGFTRLELGAKADNIASQRAALAGGFEPDGVRAARLRYPDGSFADEVRFALVNPQTARRMSP
ncbi:MAG: hypothetical protein QOG80_997 [Pseudonocardiales bacterium]|nr:hypothetical protein [Pseudonocardiales bacterium]